MLLPNASYITGTKNGILAITQFIFIKIFVLKSKFFLKEVKYFEFSSELQTLKNSAKIPNYYSICGQKIQEFYEFPGY